MNRSDSRLLLLSLMLNLMLNLMLSLDLRIGGDLIMRRSGRWLRWHSVRLGGLISPDLRLWFGYGLV